MASVLRAKQSLTIDSMSNHIPHDVAQHLGVPFSQKAQATIINEIAHLTHWQDHVNRDAYTNNWSVITLRCLQEHIDQHPILQSFSHESAKNKNDTWQFTHALQQLPTIKSWLGHFSLPLKSVRLMRLCAGESIHPHHDPRLGQEYGEARFHIPLITHTNVEFNIENHRVIMQQGELWYLNADKNHWIDNKSQEDRIHLVFDCPVSPAPLENQVSW